MAARSLALCCLLSLHGHALAQEDGEREYGPPVAGRATYYGPGYDGRPMGCGGTYWASDPTVLAVGPSLYGAMPCGTVARITGPAGSIEVVRRDSCPGCSPTTFDLSDSANALVCGRPVTCPVTLEIAQ